MPKTFFAAKLGCRRCNDLSIGLKRYMRNIFHYLPFATDRTGSGTMSDARETVDLIGSDKVEGTAVYTANGEKMGSIERIMLGKRSGTIAYAVLGFGGFLGFGNDHYPLPWASLTYDESLAGYRTSVTQKQIEGAPKYANESDWDWKARARSIDDYYGVGGPISI